MEEYMRSERQNKFNNWKTGKLLLMTYGVFIILFSIMIIPLAFFSTVGIYISLIMEALTGLASIVFGTTIGSALYEGNRRSQVWLMKNLWRMKEAEIKKRLLQMETVFWGIPSGYNFHILITRIIGIGLITLPIFFWFLFNKRI